MLHQLVLIALIVLIAQGQMPNLRLDRVHLCTCRLDMLQKLLLTLLLSTITLLWKQADLIFF